jgi:hypothetical protein
MLYRVIWFNSLFLYLIVDKLEYDSIFNSFLTKHNYDDMETIRTILLAFSISKIMYLEGMILTASFFISMYKPCPNQSLTIFHDVN